MLHCNICDAPVADEASIERADVRCNVRAFAGERFPVWRCPRCRSIHAAGDADLDRYYAQYPFHRQKYDAMIVILYDGLVRRLKRAGMKKSHAILDYGCGSGLFVEHLRRKGYARATGYDAYSERFRDPAALARRYDVVVAQDVVEHDRSPVQLCTRLAALAPGGVVAIGTPNAAAIDLADADSYAHTLHQPYHTHILSKQALLDVAAKNGWSLVRYYAKQYSNTLVPALNQRWVLHYARLFDDTVDLAFDGPRFHWRLLTPYAILLALFGYFFSRELDVMGIFRVPQSVAIA